MPVVVDGPRSPLFDPIPLSGGVVAAQLKTPLVSGAMAGAAGRYAPTGD